MRRLAITLLLAVSCACNREKIKLEPTDESEPTLASTVQSGDRQTSAQLLKGFHGVEQGLWRWTMGAFSVLLKSPEGASGKGATLTLKLAVPESIIENVKATTVTARVQGSVVGRQTYSTPGQHTLTVDVPAALLKDEAVSVEYAADPYLPAGKIDARELGVVFVAVSLDAK